MHRSLPGVYCGLTPPSVAFIGALCASRIACPCLLTCSSRPPAACVLLRQSHAPSLTTSRRASPSLGTSPASSRVRRCPPSQAYRRVPSGDASSTTSPETSCSSASISGAAPFKPERARRGGRGAASPPRPAPRARSTPARPPPRPSASPRGPARRGTRACTLPPAGRPLPDGSAGRVRRITQRRSAAKEQSRAQRSAAQRGGRRAVPCCAPRAAPSAALMAVARARLAPLGVALLLLSLLAGLERVAAAVHRYHGEKFFAVGDAYVFRGGREGLFARGNVAKNDEEAAAKVRTRARTAPRRTHSTSKDSACRTLPLQTSARRGHRQQEGGAPARQATLGRLHPPCQGGRRSLDAPCLRSGESKAALDPCAPLLLSRSPPVGLVCPPARRAAGAGLPDAPCYTPTPTQAAVARAGEDVDTGNTFIRFSKVRSKDTSHFACEECDEPLCRARSNTPCNGASDTPLAPPPLLWKVHFHRSSALTADYHEGRVTNGKQTYVGMVQAVVFEVRAAGQWCCCRVGARAKANIHTLGWHAG